jgi:hypothetical protein
LFTYQVSDDLLDSEIRTVTLEVAGTAPTFPSLRKISESSQRNRDG